MIPRAAHFDSCEEWYEAVHAVEWARLQKAVAQAQLFPARDHALSFALVEYGIWWEDVERVSRPFLPRAGRRAIGDHALALYELVARKVPAVRSRGRRWPRAQRYGSGALAVVGLLLAHYYGAPVPNLKARIQKARTR